MSKPKWEKFETSILSVSLLYPDNSYLGSIRELNYHRTGIRAIRAITKFLVCKDGGYVIQTEVIHRSGEHDVNNPEMSDDCYPYYPERNVQVDTKVDFKKVTCDNFTNFITASHGILYEQISFQEVK
jgi:hypothetical protein